MLLLIAIAEAGTSQLRTLLDSREFDPQESARVEARVEREAHYTRLKTVVGRAEGDAIARILHAMADTALTQGRDLALVGDAAGAHGWLDRSVKLHRQLLTSAPTFIPSDEAAYSIGVGLLAMDATKEGEDALTRLVTEYPASAFAADAYSRLGDIWFADGDPVRARSAFEHAAASSDVARRAYARYMLDLCLQRSGDVERALQGHLALAALPAVDRFDEELRNQVLVDLAGFFAESGKLAEGMTFFTSVNRIDLIEAMNSWRKGPR